jgi:16S rRNA pseudouridine516 synthase
VEKVYEAVVDTDLSGADIALFREGVRLSDFTAKPAELEILSPRKAKITVTEGKYHQVKRMLSAAGHQTVALHRIRFGPVWLDETLLPGQHRELREEELAALYRAAGIR